MKDCCLHTRYKFIITFIRKKTSTFCINKWNATEIKFSIANSVEISVRRCSDCSLTILWPQIIMAKDGKKKGFKALQLLFCDEIWIRRCRNKYNNFIFQRYKVEKLRIYKTVQWFTICGTSSPLRLTISWSETQLLLSHFYQWTILAVETFRQS